MKSQRKQKQFSLFNVFTGYVNIQVKGTSFDVKTDVENKRVEAVLVSGEIELLDANRNKLLDVSPGEKVTYNQTRMNILQKLSM